MKKILKLLSVVAIATLFVSCKTNETNVKVTEITKKFYTEYLNAENENIRKKVKEKYMIEILAVELDLRSKQMESDAVTGVQDDTNMLSKMVVTEGENEEWAKVTFDMKEIEGEPYRIYETNVHYRLEGDKKLMDTLNLVIYDFDQDGDMSQMEFNTKYANKPELTEADKEEIDRISKYYESLYEEGYIG